MLLAVATLVWFAVRLVLRPLMRLKSEVETRDLADLSDVDPALVHKEVRPLVAAMNGTMARMQNLIASQRRFIADASHQLRTPLTVLKTQAELALRENDAAAMRAIVQSIAATTDSTVHLANRLLTLARIEHGSEAASMAPVSLPDIVRQVGLELALPAVQKQIDLSLEAPARRGGRRPGADAARTGEQPGRQRDPLHAGRRPGGAAGGAGRWRRRAAGSGRQRRRASPRPSAKRCSGRSTARRRRWKPTRAAPGSAWRSCATSPRCTGASIVLSEGSGGRGLKVSVAFPPARQLDAPAP